MYPCVLTPLSTASLPTGAPSAQPSPTGPPRSLDPTAQHSPPPITCRVVIQGPRALGARPTIHCWGPGNDRCMGANPQQPQQQQQPNPPPSQPQYTVYVGAALYGALTGSTQGSPVSGGTSEGTPQEPRTCGVVLRLRPTAAQHRDGAPAPPEASWTGGGPGPLVVTLPPDLSISISSSISSSSSSHDSGSSTTDNDDWGVTFLGVPHLRLVDSVLADLPLSAAGPLLQCVACQHLTITNLTMQRLSGPPLPAGPELGQPPEPPGVPAPLVHGALAASGLRRVEASQVTCSNVTLANGWACMLLQYARVDSSYEGEAGGGAGDGTDQVDEGAAGGQGGDSSFVLDGGMFVGNSVVRAGPGAEGPGRLVLGAVVLGADAGPEAAGPLLLSRVELRGVVAEDNSGGSGGVLAVLDADVVRTGGVMWGCGELGGSPSCSM